MPFLRYLKYYNSPLRENTNLTFYNKTDQAGITTVYFERPRLINSSQSSSGFNLSNCNFMAFAVGLYLNNRVFPHSEIPVFSSNCYQLADNLQTTYSAPLATTTSTSKTSSSSSFQITTTTSTTSTPTSTTKITTTSFTTTNIPSTTKTAISTTTTIQTTKTSTTSTSTISSTTTTTTTTTLSKQQNSTITESSTSTSNFFVKNTCCWIG